MHTQQVEEEIELGDIIRDGNGLYWEVTNTVGPHGSFQTDSAESEGDIRWETSTFYVSDLEPITATFADWSERR